MNWVLTVSEYIYRMTLFFFHSTLCKAHLVCFSNDDWCCLTYIYLIMLKEQKIILTKTCILTSSQLTCFTVWQFKCHQMFCPLQNLYIDSPSIIAFFSHQSFSSFTQSVFVCASHSYHYNLVFLFLILWLHLFGPSFSCVCFHCLKKISQLGCF